MTIGSLAEILRNADVVLFDFDGPICSVFDGYPAPQITTDLRALAGHVRPELADALDKATGPHDLLLVAADEPELAARLELALQRAEMTAIESARPTPGAAESLAACNESGKPAAIVSNNYADAVVSYLAHAGLSGRIAHIEGRDPADPMLMKPSPYLIKNAARALSVHTGACVFIGDQTSDMEAGRAAGALTIGYANKPGKADALALAGADVVIETMTELAAAIR
ncbi:HAD family hydrolase [Kribbella sancticallisti]|uniref:HAD family hydrolase n=1 Tax=Kribbella sancticallisti TaxID=460087 RepID=A0ABP4NLL5_9ACTN